MFTVVKFDAHLLHPSERVTEAIEWVRSLGVEPNDVQPKGVILLHKGRYQLHLRQIVRNEEGHARIDYVVDELVTTPLVVDLGSEKNWPTCLNEPITMAS